MPPRRPPRAAPRRRRTPVAALGPSTLGDATTDTQRRVLDAALGLFAQRGFDGVTTAEIASRAGVAEKTLFANFGSKERLYHATVGPAGLRAVFVPEAARTLVAALGHAPPDLPGLLRRLLRNRVDFARAHPREIQLLAQHLLRNPESMQLISAQIEERLGPVIDPIVDRLRQRGQLRRDIPRGRLLRMIAGQAVSYVLACVVFRPDLNWDDDKEVEAMTQVLVEGLAPRGNPTPVPPSKKSRARPAR
jgi:AcrR family transcriptional regulator